MSKQLFITRHDDIKTSAALFDDNRLVNYFVETPANSSQVGNIYRGKVRRVVPLMQAIFVDIGLSELGFLATRDAGKVANEANADLNAIFREGQIIWVQVSKDAVESIDGLESKGVRLTTELNIDTPSLVYFPNNHAIRLSRQIQGDERREQLKKSLQTLVIEQQMTGGFIIRSSVNDIADNSWLDAAGDLWSRWQEIKQSMRQSKKVGLAYQSSNLMSRLAQLIVIEKIESVAGVSSAQQFFQESAITFMALDVSRLTAELSNLDFEKQLNQAMHPLVELPKGGSIVIEKTEALTAIDVNMGSAVQHQMSVLELNLIAAKVIFEQLRLRNISGMIIVDFINMATKKEKDRLLQEIHQLVSEDNVRVDVYGYTGLGLIELSRERIYPSLSNMVSD